MYQEAYCSKVRLFRWNEKLVNKNNLLKDSQGLCLFDIFNIDVEINHHRLNNGESETTRKEFHRRCSDKVVPFDLRRLFLVPDNLLLFTTLLLKSDQSFLPEIIVRLSKQISNHLFKDFQLSMSNNNYSSSEWKLVMVVQIRIRRMIHKSAYINLNMPSSSSIHSSSSSDNEDETSSDDNDDDDDDDSIPPFSSSENEDESSSNEEEEEDEDYNSNEYNEYISESSSDDDYNMNEYTEEWKPGEVAWYKNCYEGIVFWLMLREYLGEPKKGYLQIKAITKDEPRGFIEIQPFPLVHKHNDDEQEEVEENHCAICLYGFARDELDEIDRTVCCHVFHNKCIANWLYKSNSCPICRQPMPLLSSKNYFSLLPRSLLSSKTTHRMFMHAFFGMAFKTFTL